MDPRAKFTYFKFHQEPTRISDPRDQVFTSNKISDRSGMTSSCSFLRLRELPGLGTFRAKLGKSWQTKPTGLPQHGEWVCLTGVCVCFQCLAPMIQPSWMPTFPPTCGPPRCRRGPPWAPITTTSQPRAHPCSTPMPILQDQVCGLRLTAPPCPDPSTSHAGAERPHRHLPSPCLPRRASSGQAAQDFFTGTSTSMLIPLVGPLWKGLCGKVYLSIAISISLS